MHSQWYQHLTDHCQNPQRAFPHTSTTSSTQNNSHAKPHVKLWSSLYLTPIHTLKHTNIIARINTNWRHKIMNLTGVIITAIMYLPLPQDNVFMEYLCNIHTFTDCIHTNFLKHVPFCYWLVKWNNVWIASSSSRFWGELTYTWLTLVVSVLSWV